MESPGIPYQQTLETQVSSGWEIGVIWVVGEFFPCESEALPITALCQGGRASGAGKSTALIAGLYLSSFRGINPGIDYCKAAVAARHNQFGAMNKAMVIAAHTKPARDAAGKGRSLTVEVPVSK